MFKNVKIGMTSGDQYKMYQNKLVNLLKLAKKRYYIDLFNNFKTNTKKLWRAVNNLTNKSSRQSKIESLIVNNKILSKPSDIAEAYNSFFVSAAHELQNQLP